ncbi:MAG TPA: murein L,D-transpeptidase catalytic domain family protein, partial [Chitinophagaceae bacterium]|nr:murein L,D-transpeptidase catalytic domain family protein [Chitinophagaceae bacterium]
CREGKLNPVVFETAYRGYANLKAAGKLAADKQLISIADYSLSANTKRLWIIDLKTNKVLLNTYVAHGQGTGEEFATAFSDRENSHQSSLGFYVTGETYTGEHGLSLYLHGMDNGYNTNAYRRSVVLHGAAYVSEDFIRAHKRLGRSWGCPAVAEELAGDMINLVKDGTCLFVYYPNERYHATSYWLNKKSNSLQLEMQQNQFELAAPQLSDSNGPGLAQTL